MDNKRLYLNNSSKYKDFTSVSPGGKYGIVNNNGYQRKRVVIPFLFSTYYYEGGIPYGKIDSLWYRIDRGNAKVYVLSSSKQIDLKVKYDQIDSGSDTSNYYDEKKNHTVRVIIN